MEPVFMALGEAAGIAAKMSDLRVEVRTVPAKALEAELEKRGGVRWYEDPPARNQ